METLLSTSKTTTDYLGLDQSLSQTLVNQMQRLLADYSILYQNVRGFHWNVTGGKFFVLHEKFEELYNELNGSIDEVAERIRVLGGRPHSGFSHYLDVADLEESNASAAEEQVQAVLEQMGTLAMVQREILKVAQEAEDEGTAALLGDNISSLEELVWMYHSLLN